MDEVIGPHLLLVFGTKFQSILNNPRYTFTDLKIMLAIINVICLFEISKHLNFNIKSTMSSISGGASRIKAKKARNVNLLASAWQQYENR